MKIKLIAILVVALLSTALADNKDDKKADDYWQFEKWLQLVHQEAPHHHLQLQWVDPAQKEFFYLYCESLDSRLQLAKTAALKEFGEPIKGTNVDVRCKYDGGPSSIYVIALNHNQSDVNEIYLVIVSDELRQRKSAVQVTHIDTED